MSVPSFRRTKLACYCSYFTMSSVFSLPPLLFLTFRQLYDISYTLLGTLVLTNFCTQMAVDLIFTFFPQIFNVKKVVRAMPLITSAGLIFYALAPTVFPANPYIGLIAGTVIFSIAAGLSEVLLSPVIAAIPSETPQKDMSLLHSLYAFGVFTVVAVSTLFLRLFGNENWMYLTLFLALWPILASVLFMCSPIPDMDTGHGAGHASPGKKMPVMLLLCACCIFLGSCSENTMSNWISSYAEKALHIDKTLGDILGMAMFAILLGLTRITYAKYGKNICRMLLVSMIGAAVCYLFIGLSSHAVPSFIACILMGIFTSMLWPGTLILMEERLPGAGVSAYALMAASGDMGASFAPQLMGAVVDQVTVSDFAARLSPLLAMSPEQIGMKTGMLISALFPIAGTILILYIIHRIKKEATSASL